MNCACHDEPAYWQRDPRCGDDYGFWRCAVTKREKQRAIDKARREVKLVRQRAEWHAPGGGYIRRRRRELVAQRQRIHEQLQQLEREATGC